MPARTTIILPFRLRVPSNASPGDHAGAVIVSINGLVKSKSQKLKLEQRIATRVIIRVSGPLHPQLSIENLHASYSGHLNPFASGTVTITYTVRNTGNALLGATQQVSVHGLFGSSAHATGVRGVPLLLPGGAYQVKTRVPGVLPEVWVTAAVRLGPEGLRGDINPGARRDDGQRDRVDLAMDPARGRGRLADLPHRAQLAPARPVAQARWRQRQANPTRSEVMTPFARRARAAATLVAITLAGLAAAAPFASASVTSAASKVPFTDPGIDGWLTFCNKSNQPVTSGSLYSVPFVWKAISSAKPPAGYGTSADGRRCTPTSPSSTWIQATGAAASCPRPLPTATPLTRSRRRRMPMCR